MMATTNPAAESVPVEDIHGDARWMSLHKRFKNEAKEKEPEVLFIGDSLVQQLALTEEWEKMFVPLHCLNFGIGGDTTQNVLWRLENGELEGISPKVIVLLVGTNNHDHNAKQVAGGIVEIVRVITEKQQQAQVVVVGIPPRGEQPNPLRDKIAEINLLVSENLASDKNSMFLKLDPSLFVNPTDGTISHTYMHDYLHLTGRGYQKLCEPLLEEIQNLLKTFVKVDAGD